MHPLPLLALFALAVPGKDLPAPALTVTVRAEAQVSGATFALGEIADIAGDDKALASQVAAVQVGTSPLAGLSRIVYPADVLMHLRAAHVEPKRLNLVCPPTVRIVRGGAEVQASELVKAATAALVAARANKDDGAAIEAAPIAAHLFVPTGKVEYQAGAPRGQVELGTAVVPVAVTVDGKPAKMVEVTFRIKRMVQAVVAARLLAPHTVLTDADLAIASVEAPPGATAPLTDAASLIGKRTTRQIGAGGVLTAGSVEAAPVVTTGAKVTVEVKVGGVSISSPGVARSSGAVGETVRVFATETKKELTGIVVDPTTVRVEDHQ